MRTLRKVFDVYENYQYATFGDFVRSEKYEHLKLTPEEKAKLSTIPENRVFTELTKDDFMLLYKTLLPRQVENSKKEILEAFRRETNRKGPKRADSVVLSSDLFPGVKGAVNEINIILKRNGIEALTMPTEHNGLDFARPQGFDEALEAEKNKSPQTPQTQATAGRGSR